MLFTTAYFPPVEYFAKIAEGFTLSPDDMKPSVIYIEACENYQKQSYRNRCKFYAENGIQTLSVPVVHKGGTFSHPITEIEVDYSTPWVLRSERAIISAYESSAYFDYYKDELFELMEAGTETLFELNMSITRWFLRKLGIPAEIRLTEEFHPDSPAVYGEDLRFSIHPKKENTILEDMELKKPYYQVFAQKHGFIGNLSIMDLLFNEGPDSIVWLKRI